MTAIPFFAVTNDGLGHIAREEIQEILNQKGKEVKQAKDACLFQIPLEEISLARRVFLQNQSFFSINLHLATGKEVEEFSLEKIHKDIDLKTLFITIEKERFTFKLEFLNVKGNENRIALGKKIYPIIGKAFKEYCQKEFSVDFKNPDFIFQIYWTGEEFLLGLRLNNNPFDERSYRLYPHQASYKGDFAYALLKEAELKKDDQVLVLFSKDGVLAIEAAYYQNKLPLRKAKRKDPMAWLSLFQVEEKSEEAKREKQQVKAMDESMGCYRAARNNAQLAGVLDLVDLKKLPLEDVELKIEKHSTDKVFLSITRKDEERLHEIFYQLNSILKKGGQAIFIGRPAFDPSCPSTFEKTQRKEMRRGQSSYSLTIFQKK